MSPAGFIYSLPPVERLRGMGLLDVMGGAFREQLQQDDLAAVA